jgi:hypothetical protein
LVNHTPVHGDSEVVEFERRSPLGEELIIIDAAIMLACVPPGRVSFERNGKSIEGLLQESFGVRDLKVPRWPQN